MAAHGHAHDGHSHAFDPRVEAPGNRRRLLAVVAVGAVVLVAEVVGGLLANSLVLLSDAAHMSTDIAAVLLAYGAAVLATRPATDSKTYGYARAEIVAAFLNALALWGICAYFVWEALQRLRAPEPVNAGIVIVIGLVGLAANVAMAFMLHGGREQSLNVRSAYIHVLSDTLGSVAAVASGVGILFFDARWLDPAATLAIAALIVVWTWRLTRETLHILLEGTPHKLSAEAVRGTIQRVPGVVNVHDLHVWSITTGMENMSAHVVVEDAARGPDVVRAIRDRLKVDHSLRHVTIEIEARGSACEGCN